VVCGLVAGCRIKVWALPDVGYGGGDFALNLFLVHTWSPNFQLSWNYPSWSISSEWFAYLCFPLFCSAILRRITTRFQARVFLLMCCLATIAMYVVGSEIRFHALIQVIPTFLAGTAIFACQSASGDRQTYRSSLLAHLLPDLLVLVLAMVPIFTEGLTMVALLLTGFVVLVYWLAGLGNDCSRLWTNRFAIYLGEISYSLYMAHTLAQKVCYKLLPTDHFTGAGLIIRFGVLTAYVACVTAAVLGIYYLVE